MPATPPTPAIYPGLGRLRARRRARARHGRQPALLRVDARRRSTRTSSRRLGEAGLNRAPEGSQGWVRIVIEKPFGRDLGVARALNQVVASAFSEEQIYRIDHYLGKETVQNILVFRFANGIFEPLWNRNHVDHVQITVGESIGVEAPRRVLRGGGRAARHDPEPHPAAPLPGRDGAAGHLRRRPRARREEQGHARDPAHRRPTRWTASRVRAPVRPRLRRAASRVPGLPRGEGRRRRSRSPRRTRRCELERRQLAVGGRAVLPPHRQAPAQARERDRRSGSSARRTWSSGAIRSASPSRTSLVIRIQPDEGISLIVRRQAARARSCKHRVR